MNTTAAHIRTCLAQKNFETANVIFLPTPYYIVSLLFLCFSRMRRRIHWIVSIVLAVSCEAIVWPKPDVASRSRFHVGGLDNAPGYVGDANGMSFRQGLFHLAWQCTLTNTSGLEWCHSVSRDFVSWKTLPPMISRDGAESGGVAILDNGDMVAIFNEVGGGGHWQARPSNLSDVYLTRWHDTSPNGTVCASNQKCVVTPGIPGTDLSQAFRDGSNDGYWYVVANRPDSGGASGAANLAMTKDFTSFELASGNASVFHQYKWTRCETLKSLCGFGPYVVFERETF